MESTTKVALTTVADCQSSLHRLVTSMTASPSTVVCAIPGEVEEGERRRHIMANHGDIQPALSTCLLINEGLSYRVATSYVSDVFNDVDLWRPLTKLS